MPNPYDKAHELAKSIEQHDQFVKVKELTAKVMANPAQMKLIEEFRNKQFALHEKQIQGQQVSNNEIEQINNLHETISKNEEIKQLLEAEERLSIFFADINRIIVGPLEKIYSKSNNY